MPKKLNEKFDLSTTPNGNLKISFKTGVRVTPIIFITNSMGKLKKFN